MTETDLRWKMRQLPRELDLPRDLWPDISGRMQRQQRRTPKRWLAGLAIAASLLIAAGLGWRMQWSPAPLVDSNASLVATQARAITDEYQAALRQYQGAPLAPEYNVSLRSLDHSLAEIHRAIAADPHSSFLLEQLQKTYSRRLQLTQLAIAG